MRSKPYPLALIPAITGAGKSLICVLLFSYCTSNPIDGGGISQQNRQVKGQVTLSGDSRLEDIFVWLDGVGIGTRTDADGNFNLTLPPPSSQNSSGGLDGVFNLYYYVANYGVKKSAVLIQKGQFVYSQGDINKDGELIAPPSLTEFLSIKTKITPTVVSANSIQRIGATVTVQALTDSATVVFPNSLGGLLGAVFLRNIETAEIFIFRGPPTDTKDAVLVSREGHSRTIVFQVVLSPIPVGKYEVIPYLFVAHEEIPTALLSSLGNNVEELIKDPSNPAFLLAYLDIPFRRDVAIFEVRQ